MSPEFDLEPLTEFSLYQSPALETRVLLLFLALEKKTGKWVNGDCGTHKTVYGKTVNQSIFTFQVQSHNEFVCLLACFKP